MFYGKVARQRGRKSPSPYLREQVSVGVKNEIDKLKAVDSKEWEKNKKLRVKALQNKLANLKQQGRLYIHDCKDLEDKIKKLEEEKCKTFEGYVHNVHRLLKKRDPIGYMLVRGFQNGAREKPHEPFFLNTPFCQKCNVLLTFNSDTSTALCESCGEVSFMLCPDSEQSIGKSQLRVPKVTIYARAPLYEQFLNNFRANHEPIPENVVEAVVDELSVVHSMISSSCRPNTVSKILRKRGLASKFGSSSLRICYKIQNRPIPVLSDGLRKRLLQRFVLVERAFETKQDDHEGQIVKKKIVNFSFLTRALLMCEKEYEIAKLFPSHKTRAVLLQSDLRLRGCVEIIEREKWNASFSWVLPRLV